MLLAVHRAAVMECRGLESTATGWWVTWHFSLVVVSVMVTSCWNPAQHPAAISATSAAADTFHTANHSTAAFMTSRRARDRGRRHNNTVTPLLRAGAAQGRGGCWRNLFRSKFTGKKIQTDLKKCEVNIFQGSLFGFL